MSVVSGRYSGPFVWAHCEVAREKEVPKEWAFEIRSLRTCRRKTQSKWHWWGDVVSMSKGVRREQKQPSRRNQTIDCCLKEYLPPAVFFIFLCSTFFVHFYFYTNKVLGWWVSKSSVLFGYVGLSETMNTSFSSSSDLSFFPRGILKDYVENHAEIFMTPFWLSMEYGWEDSKYTIAWSMCRRWSRKTPSFSSLLAHIMWRFKRMHRAYIVSFLTCRF